MSEERFEGEAKSVVGRVQDGAGGLLGDAGLQARGKLNQAAGSLQDVYGKVKDQAQGALGDAKGRAQDAYGELETLVRDKPVAAVGVALGVGLVLGLLLQTGRKAYTS